MIEYLYIEHVCNKENLHTVIYPDLDHDYYWSDNFSCKFFIVLAKAGFITIGYVNEEVPIILPQLQTHYALLEHKDLHISQHVKKLLQKNTYRFTTNEHFKEVIEGIKKSYEDCWIHPTYEALLHELHQGCFEGFKLISSELSDPITNTLVAGEIGYICNGFYTGLTKFSLKEKAYSNWGTLQRVLLTQHLDTEGIHLSNLGHPQMQYKLDLGATIYSREDFLKKCNML